MVGVSTNGPTRRHPRPRVFGEYEVIYIDGAALRWAVVPVARDRTKVESLFSASRLADCVRAIHDGTLASR
jgi:hypothetical protein